MPSAIDYHSTVAALEFLVRRLIVARCVESTNPEAEMARWESEIEVQANLLTGLSLEDDAGPTTSLNALATAAELSRLAGEIADDLADARSK